MQKNIYFTPEDQERLDYIRADAGDDSDAGCIRRLILEEYLMIKDTKREEVKA